VSDVYPVQVAGTHPNKPSRGAVKKLGIAGHHVDDEKHG